jgi:hypothetical protein
MPTFPGDDIDLRLGDLDPSLRHVWRDVRIFVDARGKVRCRRAELGWQLGE